MNPIAPNSTAERTGQTGLMADIDYNIYCCAIPGPDYKFNYLESSCEIRLMRGACSMRDCDRYRAPQVKIVPIAEIQPKTVKVKTGRKPGKVKPRVCADCGKVCMTKVRRLCDRCHGYHQFKKTLKQFPTEKEIRALKHVNSLALDNGL